ncbi:Porin omp2b precursor [Pseudovibrio axinellae]|uniref:Porin n=1 Tax=Pseudovibrio axinellae TaxID=989403 RepID=A0A165WQ96_9HYPH|nr:porin [Pseudovibrio axinellae]KZL16786.1 Porin omp2b precursor [Pseudovibrio axinellae]SEQ74664.1 Porin subfamily protein [Pseudovibrio axinellae]
MNIKTLALAASAAAFATSAQAADLPMAAEPVDYVKACDAFGAGYFQLPGKETCIKLGGRIRAQYVSQDLTDKSTDNDATSYARGYIYFNSMTATDFGTIKTFVELESEWNQDAEGADTKANDVWIQLGTGYGSFLFGREASAFDAFTGYTWIGPVGNAYSDTSTLQASFTADLGNGLTATASVEDSAYRAGDNDAVDFVGALNLSQGWGSFKLAAAAHNTANSEDYGYAVGATAIFNLDMVKEGTEVTFQAQYADDAGNYIGIDTDEDDVDAVRGYSLSAGLETALTDKVSAQLDLSYMDIESTVSGSDEDEQTYAVNGSVVYSPVEGLGLALAAGWSDGEEDGVDKDDEVKVGARVQYTF